MVHPFYNQHPQGHYLGKHLWSTPHIWCRHGHMAPDLGAQPACRASTRVGEVVHTVVAHRSAGYRVPCVSRMSCGGELVVPPLEPVFRCRGWPGYSDILPAYVGPSSCECVTAYRAQNKCVVRLLCRCRCRGVLSLWCSTLQPPVPQECAAEGGVTQQLRGDRPARTRRRSARRAP